MRLIDAEELFKEEREEYRNNACYISTDYEHIFAEIDNAPTVEDKPQGDLEAIRQEIQQAKQELKSIEFAGNSAYRYFNKGIQKSLSIIDKHIQNPQDHFAEVGKISVMDKTQDCDTCKHHNKTWDELPCDGCCTAYSGYESKAVDERVDEKVDRAFNKLLEPFKKGETK